MAGNLAEHGAVVFDYLAEVSASHDLPSFARAATIGLAGLLHSEVASYNEVDVHNGAAFTFPYPHDAFTAQTGEAFARYSHENPAIVQHLRDRRPQGYVLSDFIDATRLQRTNLYNEVYRPVGIEHQASVGLMPMPGVVVGLSVSRDKSPYTDRDRDLLTRIAPLLSALHERAGLRAMVDDDLSATAPAIVLVNPDGAPVQLTGAARRVLACWFGHEADDELPAPLRRWCMRARAGAAPSAIVLRRVDDGGARLMLRLLTGPAGYDVVRLTLDDAAGRMQRMRDAGLTRRESEVAARLLAGDDVAVIARTLGISASTVRKHVEHLHAKLDVHSRTGLLARLAALAAG